jgi:hypothetical protein
MKEGGGGRTLRGMGEGQGQGKDNGPEHKRRGSVRFEEL